MLLWTWCRLLYVLHYEVTCTSILLFIFLMTDVYYLALWQFLEQVSIVNEKLFSNGFLPG